MKVIRIETLLQIILIVSVLASGNAVASFHENNPLDFSSFTQANTLTFDKSLMNSAILKVNQTKQSSYSAPTSTTFTFISNLIENYRTSHKSNCCDSFQLSPCIGFTNDNDLVIPILLSSTNVNTRPIVSFHKFHKLYVSPPASPLEHRPK